MKGVVLCISPSAVLVDLTHRVPPQDVIAGAYQLGVAWPFFPQGTVHLAVVDPGVGGGRLPIAVEAGGHLFVGPDNGLLDSALNQPDAKCYSATSARFHRSTVSRTFHGRDIFAPVAAWLARGTQPAALGAQLLTPQRLSQSGPTMQAGALVGRVVVVDGFGNLITDLSEHRVQPLFSAGASLFIGEVRISVLSLTYSEVREGELIMLIGSTGRLEVSVRGGSAAKVLGVGIGAEAIVRA